MYRKKDIKYKRTQDLFTLFTIFELLSSCYERIRRKECLKNVKLREYNEGKSFSGQQRITYVAS